MVSAPKNKIASPKDSLSEKEEKDLAALLDGL